MKFDVNAASCDEGKSMTGKGIGEWRRRRRDGSEVIIEIINYNTSLPLHPFDT